MKEREPGSDEHLIACARAKASRQGTTLEAELRRWLRRYIVSIDDFVDLASEAPSSPSRVSAEPATTPDVPASRHPPPPDATSPRPDRTPSPPASADGRGSRELAYRRLAASIRDVSTRRKTSDTSEE